MVVVVVVMDNNNNQLFLHLGCDGASRYVDILVSSIHRVPRTSYPHLRTAIINKQQTTTTPQ